MKGLTIPGRVTSENIDVKFITDSFLTKEDVNNQDVFKMLSDIRINSINRIIIGHLNANSSADKYDSMKLIIPGNIDVMVIGESNFLSHLDLVVIPMEVVCSYMLGRIYHVDNYFSSMKLM